jgi:cysteine desulfurase
MLSEADLKPSLRISFSQFNTKNDVDLFIAALKTI